MKKFVFVHEEEKAWLVHAPNKHEAIAKAVENDFSHNMGDFYYGYEDGQTQVFEIERELL